MKYKGAVLLGTGCRNFPSNPNSRVLQTWNAFLNLLRETTCRPVGPPVDVYIDGDGRGFDRWSRAMLKDLGVSSRPEPAAWEHGKRAGPDRNRKMAETVGDMMQAGWHGIAVAWPGWNSTGTWDCLKQAAKFGIPAIVLPCWDALEDPVGVSTTFTHPEFGELPKLIFE